MTRPPSASVATSRRRPAHSRARPRIQSVSALSCPASTTFRPKMRTPPTRASQSSRSSWTLPGPSVPSKPTRRSWPTSAARASRAGSGTTERHPVRSATTRARNERKERARLVTTDGRDEAAHARGIDGEIDVPVALDEGPDDEGIGNGQELERRLRRDAAAHQDRDVAHGAAHTLDVAQRGGLAGGLAADDESVGQTAMHEIARLRLELHRAERHRVLALHVGQDLDVGAQEAAVAKERVGVGLHDALIGEDGPGVNVHADELTAHGGGHGEGGPG